MTIALECDPLPVRVHIRDDGVRVCLVEPPGHPMAVVKVGAGANLFAGIRAQTMVALGVDLSSTPLIAEHDEHTCPSCGGRA